MEKVILVLLTLIITKFSLIGQYSLIPMKKSSTNWTFHKKNDSLYYRVNNGNTLLPCPLKDILDPCLVEQLYADSVFVFSTINASTNNYNYFHFKLRISPEFQVSNDKLEIEFFEIANRGGYKTNNIIFIPKKWLKRKIILKKANSKKMYGFNNENVNEDIHVSSTIVINFNQLINNEIEFIVQSESKSSMFFYFKQKDTIDSKSSLPKARYTLSIYDLQKNLDEKFANEMDRLMNEISSKFDLTDSVNIEFKSPANYVYSNTVLNKTYFSRIEIIVEKLKEKGYKNIYLNTPICNLDGMINIQVIDNLDSETF